MGLVTVLERNKVSVKFLLLQRLAGGLCLGLKDGEGHCHALTEVFLTRPGQTMGCGGK